MILNEIQRETMIWRNYKYNIKTIVIQILRYRLTVNKYLPRNEASVSRH